MEGRHIKGKEKGPRAETEQSGEDAECERQVATHVVRDSMVLNTDRSGTISQEPRKRQGPQPCHA